MSCFAHHYFLFGECAALNCVLMSKRTSLSIKYITERCSIWTVCYKFWSHSPFKILQYGHAFQTIECPRRGLWTPKQHKMRIYYWIRIPWQLNNLTILTIFSNLVQKLKKENKLYIDMLFSLKIVFYINLYSKYQLMFHQILLNIWTIYKFYVLWSWIGKTSIKFYHIIYIICYEV